MPKLTVELPQGLIDDLDLHKNDYCRDLGVPIGIGRVNLIKGLLYAGIEHAQTQGSPKQPEPQTPTLTPIIHTADGAELDWERLGTQALTPKAIFSFTC